MNHFKTAVPPKASQQHGMMRDNVGFLVITSKQMAMVIDFRMFKCFGDNRTDISHLTSDIVWNDREFDMNQSTTENLLPYLTFQEK
jgi:hypothetical protein